ncbi:MAG: methyltransferase domain-containing protein [Parcubacteria group bacterium]|nr:methyltransferase domain-containing protein [Parcubacteria group bacterium]
MTIASGGSHLLDAQAILEKELGMGAGMKYAALGVGSSAHFVLPAAELAGPDGRVYAIDIMKSVLANVASLAKVENIQNIIPVWSDLEIYGGAKEVADHSLDCISLINLLYMTKQDEHVFNEADRILKTQGRAVVIDWVPGESPFGPPAAERTSLDNVRRMAKVVQWRETHTFTPSPYHFGVVFEKI